MKTIKSRQKPDGQIERLTLNLDQIAVLASYAAAEAFSSFDHEEPKSIRQVAEDIGKTPAAVGEHVKKLTEVGLLVIAGTRKRRSRIETLYAQTAVENYLPTSGQSPEFTDKAVESFKSQMRLLERQHQAFQQTVDSTDELLDFFIHRRESVTLTRQNAQLLKMKIKELSKFAAELSEVPVNLPEGQELVRVSINAILLPTQVESKKRRQSVKI